MSGIDLNGATDLTVLDAIRATSPATCSALQSVTGLKMREVDKSLQRLRRAGKIVFLGAGKGWAVTHGKKARK